jgi:hypothetical protein
MTVLMTVLMTVFMVALVTALMTVLMTMLNVLMTVLRVPPPPPHSHTHTLLSNAIVGSRPKIEWPMFTASVGWCVSMRGIRPSLFISSAEERRYKSFGLELFVEQSFVDSHQQSKSATNRYFDETCRDILLNKLKPLRFSHDFLKTEKKRPCVNTNNSKSE